MALHIQMSEEAEALLRRNALRNKLSAFAACLAFMGLGGCMLYFTVILIQNAAPPAFETYVSPNEEDAPSKKPKVQELTSKTSPPTSQVAPSVIVSASAAAVAMAEVEIPTTDVIVGTGLEVDMGLGSGLGSGLGESGGGLGSSEAGGSTLEGTFYDLKLTRNGAQTGINWTNDAQSFMTNESQGQIACIIGEYFANGWDDKILAKHYKSPTKLYASNFYLPSCKAEYGPAAFKADKKVKPAGWCAVYRGKITAPRTGKFRFVGNGDDVLAVRFNKKVVLEAGYTIPSLYRKGVTNFATFNGMGYDKGYQETIDQKPGHEGYKLYRDETGGWWNGLGGLVAGNVFSVQEGREYPIEIFISEIPGGVFGMVLLLEDLSSPRLKDGKPVFDLFRTNFSLPDMAELEKQLHEANAFNGSPDPGYNEDSPVWTAKP